MPQLAENLLVVQGTDLHQPHQDGALRAWGAADERLACCAAARGALPGGTRGEQDAVTC